MLRRWIAALGASVTLVSSVYAAPAPPIAAISRPDGSTLRVDADGALVRSKGGVDTKLADTKATRATLRNFNVPGFGSLTEVRTGTRALFVDAAGAVIADERVGPNEDHDLVRVVTVLDRAVRRWQEAPAIGRCDARPPLFLSHLDASSKTWVRDALPVPSAPALPSTTPQHLPPMRRSLRFSSASTDGHSESADQLGAPRELDDGSDATALSIDAPARGAFVTARAPREVELTAIHVTSSAPPAALVLIGGVPAKPRYRLPLSSGTSWFVLQQPLKGACVSFVVDAPDGARVSLAELGLHTADDAPNGLERLADGVAHDAVESEGAARGLEADPDGALAALRAMPSASMAGRRRLLAVVAAHQGPLPPEAVGTLVSFLSVAAPDERRLVVSTLSRQGAGVIEPLLKILSDPSQTAEARSDVVRVLGGLVALGQGKDALPYLFEALHDDATALEAERVLTDAAPKHDEVVQLAADRLAPPADPASVAYVTRLVGIVAAGHDGRALDKLGSPIALPFPLAARVLDARGRLHAPSLYADVGRVLQQSNDPTLRRVAVTALPPATQPAARMLYESAARDADALVRERALVRLTDAHAASAEALRVAADDRWPQLRRLAYGKMSCDAAPLLAQRVFDKKTADADPDARAAALTAYARCPIATAETIAKAIARAQPVEVRETAAELLAEADPSVLPLVVKTLDAVFARGGEELPDTAVALLRAMGKLGQRRGEPPFDDKALALLRDSASDPFYPTVRMAALEALSRACPVGTAHVLDRAATDPEPAVVRAADLARQRCAK